VRLAVPYCNELHRGRPNKKPGGSHNETARPPPPAGVAPAI